ncbi:MAG: uridine phosphorylase [Clostridia bacterium]|nr:uridine phosphorylase [Clostridia bacterium]
MECKEFFHIKLPEEFFSVPCRYAILPGDPGRTELIASYMENPRFVSSNREYTAWEGYIKGEKVLAMSTGIGGPSTAICVEELIQAGIDTFVRVGSCGGINLDVCGGDLIVATGAVRMEGTSREYMPIEFPAVADFDVVCALAQAAKKIAPTHVGVVQCKDSFYGQHAPETMPVRDILTAKWQAWKEAGVLASEMESATLFTVAAVRHARAGTVLSCFWNQERAAANLPDEQCIDTKNAVKAAVDALAILIENDKNN